MILFIDTTESEARLALLKDKVIDEINVSNPRLSEGLLPSIKKLLARNHCSLNQIQKLVVVRGPGPFSRVRTAVVTANALAFGLRIPVVGITKDKLPKNLFQLKKLKATNMVLPYYSKPANITRPKKRP